MLLTVSLVVLCYSDSLEYSSNIISFNQLAVYKAFCIVKQFFTRPRLRCAVQVKDSLVRDVLCLVYASNATLKGSLWLGIQERESITPRQFVFSLAK